MRKTIHAVAATMAIALLSGATMAQTALINGEVRKVDQSAQKITIKHGPIKKLGMDEGMTMVFRVQDPAILSAVKEGDKVRFDAENVNGAFTLTKIEKSK
jgi:Cu(I)/Ag(I) efflux system protein CusF